MKIMTETTNGFCAGRGRFENAGFRWNFGTRQSGIPEFQVADLVEDYPILEEARKVASQIVATQIGENTQIGICSLYLEKQEHLD